MTDRPKAKTTQGARNDERKNGKAWKKHPKSPRRHKNPEGRTWPEKKEARRAARRKAGKHEEYLARQARAMDLAQQQAIKEELDRKRRSRQSEAQKKRARDKRANQIMTEKMKAGKV